jgi:hypothetical protein
LRGELPGQSARGRSVACELVSIASKVQNGGFARIPVLVEVILLNLLVVLDGHDCRFYNGQLACLLVPKLYGRGGHTFVDLKVSIDVAEVGRCDQIPMCALGAGRTFCRKARAHPKPRPRSETDQEERSRLLMCTAEQVAVV